MNPFTESTVARPLSEKPTDAANDSTQEEGRPRGAHEAIAGHKPSRILRPARMTRRRVRGQTVRRLALSLPKACRRAATQTLLGLAIGLATPAAWAVNVNSATAQQLESVKGIGPKTAQTIIDERTRGGSFESFDDLAERVKGIGPKKLQSLQAAGLTLGREETARTAVAPPVAPPARKAGR